MQFLSIGVKEYADDVVKQLSEELQQLKSKKINYSIDEINSEGSTSIICRIDENETIDKKNVQTYNVLRTVVSNALSDYIISQYEEKLLLRIINSNYGYFNSIEKKEILNQALRIIRNDEKIFLNNLLKLRRRNVIVRKLMDYFEGSNNIILDGFVNFRLKDYIKDLEEIVDKAIDEFLMEREYKEFICLLKYFVEIQDPKFDVIHVVGIENRYILMDELKKEITNECIKEFINEISEGEINYDDLLVSSLITLAPRRVIIHSVKNFKNKELLKTIKNVFTGKVALCKGCDICTLNFIN